VLQEKAAGANAAAKLKGAHHFIGHLSWKRSWSSFDDGGDGLERIVAVALTTSCR
jgi:hypothetical protein